MTFQVKNERVGDAYWEQFSKGETFTLKKTRRLPDLMAGLLHYRDPNPKTCTSREFVVKNPAMLEAYKNLLAKSGDSYVCWPTGDEYFTSPLDAKHPPVFISCGPGAVDGGTSSCQARTEFRGWLIEFSLPGPRRSEWKIYDNNIRRFLETLIVSECDAPTETDLKRGLERFEPRNCKPYRRMRS